jgi:hypothetical protein
MQMPGGRRTHDYPNGRPFRLVLFEIMWGISALVWMAFFYRGWLYQIAIVPVFVIFTLFYSRLVKSYERDGIAVPIPRAVGVSYEGGKPPMIRGLRIAFFALVGLIVVFGFAPLPADIWKFGIIGCVLALSAVGVSHFIAERHFVNTGRAHDRYELKPSDKVR